MGRECKFARRVVRLVRLPLMPSAPPVRSPLRRYNCAATRRRLPSFRVTGRVALLSGGVRRARRHLGGAAAVLSQ